MLGGLDDASPVALTCGATTVVDALVVANELEKQDISVEVLDLRTIAPFDKEAIRKSVAKTGRVVVAYDGYKTGGVGSEIRVYRRRVHRRSGSTRYPCVQQGCPEPL